MINFSDISEDGTYLVDASGDLHTMTYTDGYMVGVRSLAVLIPGSGMDNGPIPAVTLVGRWEDTESGITYWDQVEYIEDKMEALELAQMYGEIAIWDNANNEEIRIA